MGSEVYALIASRFDTTRRFLRFNVIVGIASLAKSRYLVICPFTRDKAPGLRGAFGIRTESTLRFAVP
jgi:hypothetical protein